jgi:hypothetical protein
VKTGFFVDRKNFDILKTHHQKGALIPAESSVKGKLFQTAINIRSELTTPAHKAGFSRAA